MIQDIHDHAPNHEPSAPAALTEVVERVAKWNFDRRAKQIKASGGAAGWWDDMPEDVKDSHREWATELLTVAGMPKPPEAKERG